jgi:two-component system phosphate regulon sensor histidine kinase PhoR
MNQFRWFLHPIFIFIISILALGLSLFLYIYWYIEVSSGLDEIIRRFEIDRNLVLASKAWVVILVLSVLVGLILIGIFMIFVYSQKTQQLYRLQHNFINNFTHELKTPLTSLRLYLQTFVKYDLERGDQIKYLDYMIADAGRLADTVNRILNLARIESKSYQWELVAKNIVSVMERFFRRNRHLFADLTIVIPDATRHAYTCLIDPPLFEMLLMNLATNAVKYNNSGKPRLEITFTPSTRHLQVHFEDNGNGFEKRERKRIFKKFYQVGRSEDMSARGSGIGLFLVQSIAKIHNGRVWAFSEGTGKGAVFTLKLPRHDQN